MIIVNNKFLALCDAENGVRLIGMDVIKRIEVPVSDGQPEANQIKEMLDFIRNAFEEHAGENSE